MRIAIIGAGMAGLSCAHALLANGHSVMLFDKGRGPGGRMSTRRISTPRGEVAFDHGAQYFTARDPAFVGQVADWERSGLIAPWIAAGDGAWVGTPSMNAPLREVAASVDVRWESKIDALVSDCKWHLQGENAPNQAFDVVVVAVPAEQVSALIEAHDPGMAARARSVRSDPCWTAMIAFDGAVPFADDCIRDVGIIGWAARNSAKPGRSGPEAWVVQASSDWSRAHIENEGATVEEALLAAFGEMVGNALPPRLVSGVHRWRYARSGTLGADALWSQDRSLGVCGDWLLGPRIEAAWLSGHRLAAMIG